MGGERFLNEYGDCHLLTSDCTSEFSAQDMDNITKFCNKDNLAFIDIETLGLSFDNPIILFGLAKIKQGKAILSQFLVHDISQERSALALFKSQIEKGSCLVTYNGQMFDIPYIKQRLAYYGDDIKFWCNHVDIIWSTRKVLSEDLPNFRQSTIEDFFKLPRGINIPGALVPHFYNKYVETGNVGPLVPLVNHNKEDLINLALIVSRLYDYQNNKTCNDKKFKTDKNNKNKTEVFFSNYPTTFLLICYVLMKRNLLTSIGGRELQMTSRFAADAMGH